MVSPLRYPVPVTKITFGLTSNPPKKDDTSEDIAPVGRRARCNRCNWRERVINIRGSRLHEDA